MHHEHHENDGVQRSQIEAYFAKLRRKNLIVDKPVRIGWKVDEYRTDKRTGPLTSVRISEYAQKLYEDAMRKWR